MIRLMKIDSKDKLRIINIWTEDDIIHRSAGVFKGNLVDTEKACKGKNIGRSNETCAATQAKLEVDAIVTKKLHEGYVVVEAPENQTEEALREFLSSNAVKYPECMLAKSYESKRFNPEGTLVSPKLDGMRCLAVVRDNNTVSLYTRGGKEINTMPHIVDALGAMNATTGWTGVLDGELYVHTQEDNFQDIMKACKKYREGISEKVEYHVYDIIDTNKNAMDRWYEYADLLVDDNGNHFGNIRPVEQNFIMSEEAGDKLHESYCEAFYEGSMWKHAHLPYKEGRGYELMKKKDFTDAEFKVVGVIPMDAWPDCGIFVCEMPGVGTFNATPKCSREQKRIYLANGPEYVGKMLTVTYFGLTDKGLPRIGVAKGFRLNGDL